MQTPRNGCSDYLGRYYTHSHVGNILIQAMNLSQPSTILDLGSGDGALTKAAAQVWKNTKLISVEIDQTKTLKQVNANHIFFNYDALREELHEIVGVPLGSVDGAVCNPPYIRPAWRSEFRTILEESGLSDAFATKTKLSADILFIAQNLRLLKSFGKLGLILPDGVLAGQNYLELRRSIINQHCIERVIELPRGVFKKTDAKAHILVLTKHGKTQDNILLHKLNEDGSITPAIQIDNRTAIKRMDFSFIENKKYFSPSHSKKTFSIGELTDSIKRGSLSSSQVRASSIKIFHSTDFPSLNAGQVPKVSNEFILTKKIASSLKTATASKGDILMCRVGRNLESKVCYVSRGFVAISDCIFRLKVKSGHQNKILKFLCSDDGRRALHAISHGVSAKHFSIKDIQNLQVSEID